MDHDTDYEDYGGHDTPPEDYGGYDTDLEEEGRQQREWEARYERWRNGERSEELEREFGVRPFGDRAPSPPPLPFGPRPAVGGGTGANNIPLGQGLWPPNSPVVPNALAPAAPLDDPNVPVGQEFRVQPVATPNPPIAQSAVVRGRGRGARGFRGGFLANNPSWRAPPPPPTPPRKYTGGPAAVVRAFLLFYRGRLADVQPHAIAVLALAVDFEVGDLTHVLSEWLAANLQLADVFRLLRLVERHPAELRDLHAAVFEFARRNAAALAELPAFAAFVKEDPELLGKLFTAVAQLVPRPRRGCPSCGPSDDEDGPPGFQFA
ncbi:hypothetical protein M3Y99_01053300 [Aphelenchoides fujianensis]|nr:hypothetical protein M3Y99_01053300 [Aphelenchoides fujianensis]